MKIVTKAFGQIEVSEKQKITINEGLLGFEDIHDFVLLDFEAGSPFYWLQAETIPEIAFLIIDPRLILPEYTLEADPKDLATLEIKEADEMLLFSIVTLHDDPSKTTVNLLGPIIINKKTHLAKQVITLNDAYSVRQPLVPEKEAQC